MSLQIGFLLFPDYTHLDFAGPFEILAALPDATCHVLAQDAAPTRSDRGMVTVPTGRFAQSPQLDILCVPGGSGHLAAMEDERFLAFLRAQAPGCRHVTSVCNGSLLLAAAGLLKGYRATANWNARHRLAAYGAIPVEARVVTDRNRVTGGGVTAGIDFGLTLAAQLAGEKVARMITLGMEYDPAPPFPGGSPRTADPALLAEIEAKIAPYRTRMADADKRVLERLGQLPS